ncbi:PREDICTED: uncharacterized protein LOC104587714 isoform X2 [Nelumbo nucifera]|nr:PREDICTED: uncharacterized protein LOC104587714 isoform X2 [Nelumbo nucifera]XP_010243727.1 PREDICTED: uncharacterized protein LOC104587714 isoform X2 [Nelumbo nucifera]XP_010243728.1 PREDICTED: uncharacterized protein LOC104587714 isoform X2 [Nelumbo nucifera]
MGVSSSRIEDDKALQLCRERKKFVKQALDGRCSLADTHVAYIHSLKNMGTALRKFVGPEAPIESSLYTSTNATPEPLVLTEKSLSQFSYSSPSMSQHVDATETFSPTPSPPYSGRFQVNYMKTGSSSTTVEEKPPFAITGTLESSMSTHQNLTPRSGERPETSPFRESPLAPATPPWDYFGPLHPIDDQFSFQDSRGLTHGLDNADDIRRLREEEGIPELEEEEEKAVSNGRAESQESEDEFDEPSTVNLVRSFKNLTRVSDSHLTNGSTTMPSTRSISSETELLNGEKSVSPDFTPLNTKSSVVTLPMDEKKAAEKEGSFENKLGTKDFLASIKEIEFLFSKAAESGKEVPRMLEANKLHFRPIFPGKEGSSTASLLFKVCFSCGKDPTHFPEELEPAPTEVKYLTWHRSASSCSSSSRNPLCSTLKDDMQDINNYNSFCMNSGSHASTLDRLYAWERKLYDEVKASGMIRREYDVKCKLLRQQESKEENIYKIDKTRAVVKDLHSRIKVAIHRIDSISKRIEELRDKELQPQLEELIAGLNRMWEMMLECHSLQVSVIHAAYNSGSPIVSMQSESHRQATMHLEYELSSLSSRFTKWISAQKSYLQAINGWLHKCILQQQRNRRKKNRSAGPSLREEGPPIYVTCGFWLDKLEVLPTKDVVDSIKTLAADTSRFLPHLEKTPGNSSNNSFPPSWKVGSSGEAMVGTTGEAPPQDWNSGFDHFKSSLVGVLENLNQFAQRSVIMYSELSQAIQNAKGTGQNSVKSR